MHGHYILKDKKAVPVDDIIKWATQFESQNRRVAQTELGVPKWKYWLSIIFGIKRWQPVRISTVFLGLDRQYGEGEPLIFETMIFGGELDREQHRYSTWEQAEAGHKAMIERVKQAQKDL
uniref:Uncharacterized protein n=1 Tax=viral metagenome TaxID=1070528 RepID=A0A6H1ZQK1_9ZZZZ